MYKVLFIKEALSLEHFGMTKKTDLMYKVLFIK
jgi:hypothetical protein